MVGKGAEDKVKYVAQGNDSVIIGMTSDVFLPQNSQQLNDSSASDHWNEQADPNLIFVYIQVITQLYIIVSCWESKA